MTHRRTSALLTLPAITAIAALALTGCTKGDSSATANLEEGPLSTYMAALWDGEEYTQEQYDEELKQTEELVAACMQNEGFEYVPDVNNGGVVFSDDSEDEGPQWGTEEFAKEFGYGITTDPWGGEMTGGEDDYVDPNGDYVNSLSESEQEAYYETLYGTGPTEEQMLEMEESGNYESDWTQEGCQGAARHEISQDADGATAAYEDPEFTELFAEIENMYAAIWDPEQKSEEVAALDAKWSDCMSEQGYTEFATSDDANMQISDEVNAIYEGVWGDGSEQITESQATELQKQADAEVKKLTEREIEVATANWKCKDKIGYDKELQKLQFELEQQFVDEHKAELDALLAKYSTKE